MITKRCISCGKKFIVYPYREHTAVYCSIKCQHRGISGDGNARYWLGKKRGRPWNYGKKLHYDVWNKGKKFPRFVPWNKGKAGVMPVPWNKGKKLPKDLCLKYSQSQLGKDMSSVKGKNHWNWKGGSSALRKKIQALSLYYDWREAVFKRDGYRCVECGVGGKIQAHHVVSFGQIIKKNKIQTISQAKKCKSLWDVDNGKSLCVLCHRKTDSYKFNQYIRK